MAGPYVDPKYQYTGSYDLLDEVEVVGKKMKVGELILSPTRTYMPLIQSILADDSIHVSGMIHCTGGGHSKVVHFVDQLRIIKDNLLSIPSLFRMIVEELRL